MQRARRSPIWKISKIELENLINRSSSWSEILNHFCLANKGGNYQTLKSRIKYDNIDVSELKEKIRKRAGFARIRKPKPINEFLQNGVRCNRSSLRKRLIKEDLLKEICDECGIGPFWNNRRLVLQLDHINGNPEDNRIENLRLLCPNCHTQTDTFAGKRL